MTTKTTSRPGPLRYLREFWLSVVVAVLLISSVAGSDQPDTGKSWRIQVLLDGYYVRNLSGDVADLPDTLEV